MFVIVRALRQLIAYIGMVLFGVGAGFAILGLPIFYLRTGGVLPSGPFTDGWFVFPGGWAGLFAVAGTVCLAGVVALLLAQCIRVPKQSAAGAERDRATRLDEARRELSKLERLAAEDIVFANESYSDRMALQGTIKYLEGLAAPIAAGIAEKQEAKRASRERSWK